MKVLAQISGFKKVLDLINEGKKDEALVLQRALQDQFMALYKENETLRGQLAEVADILDLSDCIVFDGHMYWLEDEGEREGPYCQVCYDRDGELVRLAAHDRHWECKNCNNLYMKPHAKPSVSVSMTPKETSSRAPIKEPIPLFAKP